ncbi:MAG: hypothetical protein OXE43_09770 [Chloroflexi bacterium]|nr:hypothetical protein [Chloroflexota bacterium]
MRTTLTLDEDIVATLKERARLLEKPFKQVVNEVLRRGLSDTPDEEGEPPSSDEERPVFRVKPIASGFAPGVDPLKLKEIDAELETQEILRKMQG